MDFWHDTRAASMVFSEEPTGRTGMLRKPPKKVVDLAAYKRSSNCTRGSNLS